MSARWNLPPLCIALGFQDPERLYEHAHREAQAGERFLEFRLDFLPDPAGGVPLIARFLAQHPECIVMATCRRHQNHGHYNGSVEEQYRILSAAVDAGASAIDVEIESAESGPSRLHQFDGRALLVLSYHNFEGTPALEPVARRMFKVPADIYKIVTTARKPSDNLRLLALAKAHPRTPLVLLAMGELGFPTRVLSRLEGGVYSYAAPSMAEGTAAGQVCARQMRQLYRIEKLKRMPKLYGVIADPVRHSISPAVHNRAMQARRLEALLLPFLVPQLQLKDFFHLALNLPLAGFCVTIPHKQRVMRYLDVVDPLARRIGAVNTVWRKAGKWRGSNTDAVGVRAPLEKRLRLSRSRVLVLGSGGAARAAAFSLSAAGAKVSITGRNSDRVRALAKLCGGEALSREQTLGGDYDAVVHATPLGMWPHTEECFYDGPIPGRLVFDMVYTPKDTLLLARAREQGKQVIPGIEMFIEQAAAQFELWSGESAPRAVMQRAAEDALERQRQALAARTGR